MGSSLPIFDAGCRAVQFAVREAQADLESKLRAQAARANAVAAAWPPQPAAVVAAAADLRQLLQEGQQVASIARAVEPREVPLLPIQHTLEQHTARLQQLLSESLKMAAAALEGSGVCEVAPHAVLAAAQAPVGAGFAPAGGQPPPPPQRPVLQAASPPTPRLLFNLLPMLLAGQQAAAGQQVIGRLINQRMQGGQQQQGSPLPQQQQEGRQPQQPQHEQGPAKGRMAAP